MASDFIDVFLQMLVERDILQGIPSWELLKDYLVQQCMMDPHSLENRRGEIVEKFVRCKQEQLEKAIPDLMGTTSNTIKSASPDEALLDQEICEPAGLEQRTTKGKHMNLEEEEEASEALFHPEVDEELSVSVSPETPYKLSVYSVFPNQTNNTHSEGLLSERPCFMSVCLPNGKWEGAALKYCKEEESYVSLKIIERYKLGKEVSADGRVRLTCRLYGEEETNVTQFTVLENLKCDFMLGTRHCDEDFNREDSSEDDEDVNSVSSRSKYSEPLKPPLPQMYSLPGHTIPDLHEYAKLIGVANAESIATMMREFAISNSGSHTSRPGRRLTDDTQSAPSLVPSSRRPRQRKKGPPTAVSVEQPSAQRHNGARK